MVNKHDAQGATFRQLIPSVVGVLHVGSVALGGSLGQCVTQHGAKRTPQNCLMTIAIVDRMESLSVKGHWRGALGHKKHPWDRDSGKT